MDFRPGRRRLALATAAIVAAIALTTAACTSTHSSHIGNGGTAGPTGKPQKGGTVSVGWVAASPNFIFPVVPATNSDGYNTNLQSPLWPDLTYNGDGAQAGPNPKENLYSSIAYSNGDKTITLTLKPWKWSDGQPITARDLVFVYNLLKAAVPNWFLYLPGLFPDDVASVTGSGQTAVINLTRAFNPSFYTEDVLSIIPLLPQHAWDKESDSGAVGNYDQTSAGAKQVLAYLQKEGANMATFTTNPLWKVVDGPWQLAQFNGSTGVYGYVPNPAYSGPDKPILSTVTNLQFTSSTASLDALRSGQTVDVAALPLNDIGQLPQLKAEGYSVASYPIPGEAGIYPDFWNAQTGPLARQLYIRQALEDLINRPQIVAKVFNGYADPGNGPVPVAGFSQWLSPLEKSGGPYPYSPASATKLLTAHGWKVTPNGTTTCASPGTAASECGAGITAGEKLSFQLLYSSGSATTDAEMAAIQSSEAQAGVTVSLKPEPFDTLASTVGICTQAKHPAASCGWQFVAFGYTPYNGPYPTGSGIFNSGGNGNQGGYTDPAEDSLVNATEYGSSTATFFQYEDYTARQLPQLWLPLRNEVEVYRSNLGGFLPVNSFSGGLNPQVWYYTK
ncbi:MAG TPA: ABC transporter substrate-binding protein [Trebonia sp.]|jgi:peptide/nickel transport system substrate-binding protein|nr:ABC transporter substrate-binding protein [Trebonia sp.]